MTEKGFTILTQAATASKDVLPYNAYFRSSPDLVVKKDSHMLVVSAPDTEQDDTDSDHSDEEDITLVSKLKSRTGGKYQLYGEAFNVASTHATQDA